jgi:hypothetical protein
MVLELVVEADVVHLLEHVELIPAATSTPHHSSRAPLGSRCNRSSEDDVSPIVWN